MSNLADVIVYIKMTKVFPQDLIIFAIIHYWSGGFSASFRWAISEPLSPLSSSINTSQEGQKLRWNVIQSMLEMSTSLNTEHRQTVKLTLSEDWLLTFPAL